jgi:hypothetical protein
VNLGYISPVPASFQPGDAGVLRQLAEKFMPWERPDEVLTNLSSLAIRLLNDAEFKEVREFERIVGTDYLREVLSTADPVLFDTSSWSYWHLRLGLPQRPQPKRCTRLRSILGKEYGGWY